MADATESLPLCEWKNVYDMKEEEILLEKGERTTKIV